MTLHMTNIVASYRFQLFDDILIVFYAGLVTFVIICRWVSEFPVANKRSSVSLRHSRPLRHGHTVSYVE